MKHPTNRQDRRKAEMQREHTRVAKREQDRRTRRTARTEATHERD